MANNEVIKILDSILNFIEDSIYENISTDSISHFSNISKAHLNRIFKAYTNKSLISYVRSRKLTHSIDKVLNTEIRIIDIAMDYSFDFEQSYIRSFKNEFGVSPHRARKEKKPIPITNKINLNYLIQISNNGIMLEPTIVVKPQINLVGITYTIDNRKEDRFELINRIDEEFLYEHIVKIKNVNNPITFIRHIEYPTSDFSYKFYTPCAEVLSVGDIPENMSAKNLQTAKYAVFKYIGFHHPKFTTEIRHTDIYRYIHKDWLPVSGYSRAAKYSFESVRLDISRDDYCEVDIYIPIKDKSYKVSNIIV